VVPSPAEIRPAPSRRRSAPRRFSISLARPPESVTAGRPSRPSYRPLVPLPPLPGNSSGGRRTPTWRLGFIRRTRRRPPHCTDPTRSLAPYPVDLAGSGFSRVIHSHALWDHPIRSRPRAPHCTSGFGARCLTLVAPPPCADRMRPWMKSCPAARPAAHRARSPSRRRRASSPGGTPRPGAWPSASDPASHAGHVGGGFRSREVSPRTSTASRDSASVSRHGTSFDYGILRTPTHCGLMPGEGSASGSVGPGLQTTRTSRMRDGICQLDQVRSVRFRSTAAHSRSYPKVALPRPTCLHDDSHARV